MRPGNWRLGEGARAVSARSVAGFRSLAGPPAILVATTDFSPEGPLSKSEESYMQAAVESRRTDFATGRRCAVQGLNQLGLSVSSLDRGSGREPLWPGGVVGSITHCEGLCAAAVSLAAHVRFLGIDAEPNVPLKEKILERISSASERESIRETEASGFSGKTLFSAKEAIFKAFYPAVHAYFGFEEVEITATPGTGTFEAVLSPMLRDCTGLSSVTGRYLSTPDHTMTIVQVPQ